MLSERLKKTALLSPRHRTSHLPEGLMKGVTKWAKSELMNLGRDAIRRFEGKWVSRGGRIPFPRAEM